MSKTKECTEELFTKSPEVITSVDGLGDRTIFPELIMYTKDGGPPLKEAGQVQKAKQQLQKEVPQANGHVT